MQRQQMQMPPDRPRQRRFARFFRNNNNWLIMLACWTLIAFIIACWQGCGDPLLKSRIPEVKVQSGERQQELYDFWNRNDKVEEKVNKTEPVAVQQKKKKGWTWWWVFGISLMITILYTPIVIFSKLKDITEDILCSRPTQGTLKTQYPAEHTSASPSFGKIFTAAFLADASAHVGEKILKKFKR